jgi:hypothetical protein
MRHIVTGSFKDWKVHLSANKTKYKGKKFLKIGRKDEPPQSAHEITLGSSADLQVTFVRCSLLSRQVLFLHYKQSQIPNNPNQAKSHRNLLSDYHSENMREL